MRRGGATIAIVSTRLRKEARVAALAVCACALLGFVQRWEDAAAQLAGCLIFTGLIGISTALVQRRCNRFRELELCELAAPLYGRELARATALVPCIVVSASVIGYWIVSAVFSPPPYLFAAVSLAAGNAVVLIALGATLRDGVARALYVAMACAAAGLAFAARDLPGAALLGAGIIGFIALRQYGEALARYDPI